VVATFETVAGLVSLGDRPPLGPPRLAAMLPPSGQVRLVEVPTVGWNNLNRTFLSYLVRGCFLIKLPPPGIMGNRSCAPGPHRSFDLGCYTCLCILR
jgi:hypothetical protein